MTEENYNYRTSQIMLRNQFQGVDRWKIPMIPKCRTSLEDFEDLLLIGFDKVKSDDREHMNRMVHFFLYDYRFERVWTKPDFDLHKLAGYRAVFSPDFSMYLEMAPVMQLYNVFRNRWCGAYWASKGIRVIPTINWGDDSTFDFCFEGVEKGSVVAVSTYMASEHDNRQAQKDWFMAGYNEMLRRIEPEKIICYNTPFPEMEGDIVYVDYEQSSWKFMSHASENESIDLDAFRIGGQLARQYDTISPFLDIPNSKGGGSAYGGKWRPNPKKPSDQIYFGPPNSIQRYFMPTRKGGYWLRVKYDMSGKASFIRHETDHGAGAKHSDPHDHSINWDSPDQHPEPGPPINYWDGAPEFKQFQGGIRMEGIVIPYDPDAWQFHTISEFKQSMRYGAEVVIEWKGEEYGIWSENGKISITHSGHPEEEAVFQSSDEALEYIVAGDRLRDVITQVIVIDRTI